MLPSGAMTIQSAFISILVYISWARLNELNTVQWITDDGETTPTVEITYEGEIIKIPLREAPFCRLWETHKCLCFMLRKIGHSPDLSFASFSYCYDGDIRGHFLNKTDYFEVETIKNGFSREYNVTKYPPAEKITETVIDNIKGLRNISDNNYYFKPLSESGLKDYETGFIPCLFAIHPRILEDYSENKIEFHLQDVINDANEYLHEFNLVLVYKGWKEANKVDQQISTELRLKLFHQYGHLDYIDEGTYHTIVILYSPTEVFSEDGGNIGGNAIVWDICSPSTGVYVNYQKILERFTLRQTALTLVHEIGHNLGLEHDQDTACKNIPEGVFYIMNASSINKPLDIMWSNCSKEFMESVRSKFFCLKDKLKPPRPSCKNGVLEDGEQCECVSPVCEKCCDDTCKLTPGSICSSGPCCDKKTCKPRIRNDRYTCRRAKDLCDIPEMCSGRTNKCPVNYVVADGYDCGDSFNRAYCFNGMCGKRQDVCSWIFTDGSVGGKNCYDINLGENIDAGCGPTFTDHKNVSNFPCKEEDKYCGKIFCQNASKDITWDFEYAQYYEKRIKPRIFSTTPLCSSLKIGENTRFLLEDPTFVQNGSACGNEDGRMCVKQKCSPLPGGCPENCPGKKVQHPETKEWLPAYIIWDPDAEPESDESGGSSISQWFIILVCICGFIASITLSYFAMRSLKGKPGESDANPTSDQEEVNRSSISEAPKFQAENEPKDDIVDETDKIIKIG